MKSPHGAGLRFRTISKPSCFRGLGNFCNQRDCGSSTLGGHGLYLRERIKYKELVQDLAEEERLFVLAWRREELCVCDADCYRLGAYRHSSTVLLYTLG